MRAGAELQSDLSYGGLPGRAHSKPTKITGKQCPTKKFQKNLEAMIVFCYSREADGVAIG